MLKRRLIGLLLVLAVCATAVGVALAASGKTPAKAQSQAHARAVVGHTASPAVAKARVHSVKAAPRSTAAEPPDSGAADTDNVQQGDQTAPDSASTAEGASSESSPGDSTVDGVDAGGDHQCPPSCATGENP